MPNWPAKPAGSEKRGRDKRLTRNRADRLMDDEGTLIPRLTRCSYLFRRSSLFCDPAELVLYQFHRRLIDL